MATNIYSIFPHGEEYAVCHAGSAWNSQQRAFQKTWVVDHICATMVLAIECQNKMVIKEAAFAKRATDDCLALARRR